MCRGTFGSVCAGPRLLHGCSRHTVPAPSTVSLVAPLSDAKRWHLQVFGKAKATLTRAGDVLVLHTSAVDGTDYNAQLQSVGPSLTEGQTYTLHFQAKANAQTLLARVCPRQPGRLPRHRTARIRLTKYPLADV